MEKNKIQLILASQSPRRKELLSYLNIPFQIVSLNVEEKSGAQNPRDFCLEIAALKGLSVFEHLRNIKANDSLYVVSADTIVALDGKIFEKPLDRNHAKSFLTELSGKTHSVFTAVVVNAFIESKIYSWSFVDESRVTFDVIDSYLLEAYLNTGDSLDKAGAYGIQGASLSFISKVDGSYSNVVGFPLTRFVQESKDFFAKIYPHEVVWPKLF